MKGDVAEELLQRVLTGEPVVKLVAQTDKPYDLAVASAKTCYSPNLYFADQVTEGQRERIGKSIYEAGHHTPFQHPTFVFGLENVSRQFVWSFLHSHPFYNSEQSSQRYNVLDQARAFVPPGLSGDDRETYESAVLGAWRAYNEISEILKEDYRNLMSKIVARKLPILGANANVEKKTDVEIEKKSIEMARYVLPVAAYTTLYHTVSGIVLQRYIRMINSGDCPTETRQVVGKMVEAVRRVDPNFIDRVSEGPLPPEDLPENRYVGERSDAWAKEFDRRLAGRTARLVSHDPNAEGLVASGVREVVGATEAALSDDDAIDLVTNPRRNPLLLDTLNSWSHDPVMRSLNHAQYTFIKKISHTADSQDQRHRTVPASRPLLTRVHTREPDYVTPEVIALNPDAKDVYDRAMIDLWEAKEELIANGVSDEFACYLLPNAVSIRFTTSGSMLDLMHKWRLRTCFNAQEEIYNASYEELMQVAAVHPRLTRHQGPPCLVRKGLVDHGAPLGPCPEGTRWCGIDVWRNWPNVRRPF